MRRWVALTVLLAMAMGLGACARARYGRYQGAYPAPGAITAFDTSTYVWHEESKAGAPPFLVPGSTDPGRFRVGTLQLDPEADTVVILVYGDNREGFRLMTTRWGVPAVISLGSPVFTQFLWGVINIPVALVQGVFPKLDFFRDLVTVLWTHEYSGGAEERVLAALQKEIERPPRVNFVLQTGDVVENGRRGRQWERFVKRHTRMRQTVPYVACVGNHERTWDQTARDNWDAVMGRPAQKERYWYAIDFPESIARMVFLDSNVLADPSGHYPDSIETVLANEQLAWVDSALAVPARYRFVVLHHPLVTSGHYLSDWKVDDSQPIELKRRGRLLEICRRRRVTAVIAGHEHLYQRTFVRGRDGRGFWHITTGGGGSPLYRLTDRERKGALALTLPDSSVITWNEAKSIYHYSRLTMVRRPKPNDDRILLDVYAIKGGGRVALVDHVDLTDLPTEERREPIQRATTAK
jgi:hypothetical protein